MSLQEEETPETSLFSRHTEERSCEDMERKWTSASWEERSHQKPTLLAPWSWTSSFSLWYLVMTTITILTNTPPITILKKSSVEMLSDLKKKKAGHPPTNSAQVRSPCQWLTRLTIHLLIHPFLETFHQTLLSATLCQTLCLCWKYKIICPVLKELAIQVCSLLLFKINL